MEGIWILAVLACPLIMGAMMFLMMRGHRGQGERHEKDAR